tara:strand:- start:26 stop:223 length:198 start_codon:yes stop_codon:yes gene_type:complete
MLKKYTKYAATAFAVASLSTFMIGCGGAAEEEGIPVGEGAGEEPAPPEDPADLIKAGEDGAADPE